MQKKAKKKGHKREHSKRESKVSKKQNGTYKPKSISCISSTLDIAE